MSKLASDTIKKKLSSCNGVSQNIEVSIDAPKFFLSSFLIDILNILIKL